MNHTSSMSSHQQLKIPLLREPFADKSIQILLENKQNHNGKLLIPHKQLLQSHDNQLITVPIKEYSNKFLREKKKEEIQGNSKKKEPFLNSHLQNNRKLISEFKKCKGRSQKFNKSLNKENGDFIIHNLLFDKNDHLLPAKPSMILQKTIFGSLTENINGHSNQYQVSSQESCLFDKDWKTAKNQNPFLTKKEVYEKICQKQRSSVSQNRKKCKTINDVTNFYNSEDKEKKVERISTSRALQKYSKIIKVNPEHGKIEKMKIKKELAKSLRFQNTEKSEFQTKKIALLRKQTVSKNKNIISHEISKRHHSIDPGDKENENSVQGMKLQSRLRSIGSREDLKLTKMDLFSSGIKFKKLRKFSQQVDSYKKCATEAKSIYRGYEPAEDFEINGWDINF